MSIQNQIQRVFAGLNTSAYRISGGKVGGKISGAPVLLLNTVGRKSGKQRTTPLLYLKDGDRYLIVGSYAGAPTDPAWVLNLRANPESEIEIGKQKITVTAAEVPTTERDALWPKLDAMFANYAEYRTKTDRAIPIIALTPRA